MKKIFIKAITVSALVLFGLQVSYAESPKKPMPNGNNIGTSLSHGKPIVGPTDNIVEESLNAKDQQYVKEVYNVKPGVYSLTGFGMDNINVIETKTGLIVIDGGMTPDDAEEALRMLPKEVAEKPVKAFIYTHWHYIFGAGKWNVNKDTRVIAHKNHKAELDRSFAASNFKMLTSVRGGIQLGAFLPEEGPDSPAKTGLVRHLASDTSFYLPPTEIVGDEDNTIEIDGVKVVTSGAHSDTLDGLALYFPDLKITVDNIYWAHGMMNFSTLRGDRWRDLGNLKSAGQWLLNKDVDFSLKVHGKPVDGKTFAAQVKAQNDLIDFFNKTVNDAIAKGLSPDELQYQVKLPKSLASNPHLEQNYGEFSYHVRRYYADLLHFFGNDSIELHPLPRNVEAQKMVKAMGGLGKVKSEVEKAYKNGDYQWSAQLATYGIRVGATEFKQLKANALRAMAQVATAANTRNWYLTHALVLEGKVKLPIVLKGDY